MKTRIWHIIALRTDGSGEERRGVRASTLSEALCIAERRDAGHTSYLYGIDPEHYTQARKEGIAFNAADGLLIDA